ncbi:MAG TPA: hypothetical protein VLE72_03555 [Candidatus Saccharimonadales bacterium]|nr:hypothetical protein [Candidatus Saccharimonadales bacterium]
MPDSDHYDLNFDILNDLPAGLAPDKQALWQRIMVQRRSAINARLGGVGVLAPNDHITMINLAGGALTIPTWARDAICEWTRDLAELASAAAGITEKSLTNCLAEVEAKTAEQELLFGNEPSPLNFVLGVVTTHCQYFRTQQATASDLAANS